MLNTHLRIAELTVNRAVNCGNNPLRKGSVEGSAARVADRINVIAHLKLGRIAELRSCKASSLHSDNANVRSVIITDDLRIVLGLILQLNDCIGKAIEHMRTGEEVCVRMGAVLTHDNTGTGRGSRIVIRQNCHNRGLNLGRNLLRRQRTGRRDLFNIDLRRLLCLHGHITCIVTTERQVESAADPAGHNCHAQNDDQGNLPARQLFPRLFLFGGLRWNGAGIRLTAHGRRSRCPTAVKGVVLILPADRLLALIWCTSIVIGPINRLLIGTILRTAFPLFHRGMWLISALLTTRRRGHCAARNVVVGITHGICPP